MSKYRDNSGGIDSGKRLLLQSCLEMIPEKETLLERTKSSKIVALAEKPKKNNY